LNRPGRGGPVRGRRARRAAGFLALLALLGCSETVLRSSEESEANRAAAALERHGVPAALASSQKGRTSSFELRVDEEDAPYARTVLAAYGFPRAPRAGAAALGAGSGLVSSPVEERARIAAAVARDLEQSLEAVDGVVEARVHLTFPLGEDAAFGVETAARAPRASTLVRHVDRDAPLRADDVRRLVAGAVDGLDGSNVEVVFRQVQVPARPGDGWETLGPFVVRAGGRAALLALIVGGLATIAALAALLAWSRVLLRRTRGHAG
jgi:type III secretion system YscJ/HrcJ family lipoprotein